MTKQEKIAYAITKECSRYSLVDWCENWGFSCDDFEDFIEHGKTVVLETRENGAE